MNRRPQKETTENTGHATIVTTAAGGRPKAIDVDEWLYQATRVRAFTPPPVNYAPRHRGTA